MRDISFIDKTYDHSKTNLYHLTVQISLDGFCYSVLDIPNGKYILLDQHHFFLKRARMLLKHVGEVIEQSDIFKHEFKSVDILYSTRKFTLVPQSFFGKGSLDKYLWFNHKQEKGFIVEKTLLPKAECWCIFDIPQNLSTFLSSKFPKVTVKHHLFALVESSLKKNWPYSERGQVHLNFFRDTFEIVVIIGPKLILCNMFNYSTDRDVLYHVLATFDQLKFSPETTGLILHGHLPSVSPVYHLFKKYVKSTAFARLDTTFQYSYTFSQLPEHYYSTILGAYKCE